MKAVPFALCLVATLSLQGCFFLFIPGSVVSAASDAITGSSGSNCVSTNAKVGDHVRMSDGVVKQVKSLSGTSTRCQDSNLPIRAELVAAVSPAVVDDGSFAGVSVKLPSGWLQKDAPSNMAGQNVRFYALNQSTDCAAALYSFSRQPISDIDAFISSRQAGQLSRLENATSSAITHTSQPGRDLYQYVVVGAAPTNKARFAYVVSVMVTERSIVTVMAWTSEVNLQAQRTVLENFYSGITGQV